MKREGSSSDNPVCAYLPLDLVTMLCIYCFLVRLLEKLGSGQFGQVCKGLWRFSGHTMEIAVKTLKPDSPEEEKVKFLQEAAIMGQFSHPNVVKLYGVVTVGEPVSCLFNLQVHLYFQHGCAVQMYDST